MGTPSARRLATVRLAMALLAAGRALAADGDYDPAFGDGGKRLFDVGDGSADIGQAMSVLPDGRIVVAGSCQASTPSGVRWPLCLARLRPDGSSDPTFGPHGTGRVRLDHFAGLPATLLGAAMDLARLPDGRLALLADAADANGVGPGLLQVVVLRPDGDALDAAAGGGAGWIRFRFGGAPFSAGRKLALQADGKLLVAGVVLGPGGNFDMAVARLDADAGGLDAGFGLDGTARVAFDRGGGNDDAASALAVQPDGRIALGGTASVSASLAAAAAARLLPDGRLDPAFGPDHDGRLVLPTAQSGFLGAVAPDRHGRLLAIGAENVLGGRRWRIHRLNADGSPDAGFNGGAALAFDITPGQVGDGYPVAVVPLPGGGLLAAGSAKRIGSPGYWFGVARLRADGTLDPAFGDAGRRLGTFAAGVSPGHSDTGMALAIGAGGLLVGGYGQTGATDKTRFGVARLRFDPIFADGFEASP